MPHRLDESASAAWRTPPRPPSLGTEGLGRLAHHVAREQRLALDVAAHRALCDLLAHDRASASGG